MTFQPAGRDREPGRRARRPASTILPVEGQPAAREAGASADASRWTAPTSPTRGPARTSRAPRQLGRQLHLRQRRRPPLRRRQHAPMSATASRSCSTTRSSCAPVINQPITRRARPDQRLLQRAIRPTTSSVLLRAGALPAPLTVVEERSVGPELGADSIRRRRHRAGGRLHASSSPTWPCSTACSAGSRTSRSCSSTSLLQIAVLSLLEATLTLPGMAGILLTLGVAVDANILINERIREEVKQWPHPHQRARDRVPPRLRHHRRQQRDRLPRARHAVRVRLRPGPRLRRHHHRRHRHHLVHRHPRRPPADRPVVYQHAAPPCCRCKRHVHPPAVPPRPGRHTTFAVHARPLSSASCHLRRAVASPPCMLFFYPGLHLGIDFRGGIVMEVRTDGPADFAKLRAGLAAARVPEAGLQRFGGRGPGAHPPRPAGQTRPRRRRR